MKYLWLTILLLLCATIANAEEYAEIKELNLDRKLSLSLEDTYSFNTQIFEDNFVKHVTFGGWIPGSIKVEYIGIHGIVLDQAEKRIKHAAKRQIRRRYHHGNISDADTNAAFASLNGSVNPYGNWWDRKWFHSLPANKGGAPYAQKTLYVGHHIHIPNNWGVITYLRNKFESIGDIWVRNDHLYDNVEESNSVTAPGETKKDVKKNYSIDDFNRIEYRNTSIIVDGEEIDYEWFRGNFYHFRFKPSLRIKGGPELNDFVDELSLRFVVELFSNNRTHFADLSFFTRYSIPNNELFISVALELLTW